MKKEGYAMLPKRVIEQIEISYTGGDIYSFQVQYYGGDVIAKEVTGKSMAALNLAVYLQDVNANKSLLTVTGPALILKMAGLKLPI